MPSRLSCEQFGGMETGSCEWPWLVGAEHTSRRVASPHRFPPSCLTRYQSCSCLRLHTVNTGSLLRHEACCTQPCRNVGLLRHLVRNSSRLRAPLKQRRRHQVLFRWGENCPWAVIVPSSRYLNDTAEAFHGVSLLRLIAFSSLIQNWSSPYSNWTDDLQPR